MADVTPIWACYRLIPVLISCGKNSGALTTQIVSGTLSQLINCIATEPDASFLASLYRAFSDSMRLLGGPSSLPAELHDGVVEATKRQLQSLADKRKARAARPANQIEEEREDLLDFRHHADLQTRHDIAVQFLVYEAQNYRGIPIRDKDPEQYVRENG